MLAVTDTETRRISAAFLYDLLAGERQCTLLIYCKLVLGAYFKLNYYEGRLNQIGACDEILAREDIKHRTVIRLLAPVKYMNDANFLKKAVH